MKKYVLSLIYKKLGYVLLSNIRVVLMKTVLMLMDIKNYVGLITFIKLLYVTIGKQTKVVTWIKIVVLLMEIMNLDKNLKRKFMIKIK